MLRRAVAFLGAAAAASAFSVAPAGLSICFSGASSCPVAFIRAPQSGLTSVGATRTRRASTVAGLSGVLADGGGSADERHVPVETMDLKSLVKEMDLQVGARMSFMLCQMDRKSMTTVSVVVACGCHAPSAGGTLQYGKSTA